MSRPAIKPIARVWLWKRREEYTDNDLWDYRIEVGGRHPKLIHGPRCEEPYLTNWEEGGPSTIVPGKYEIVRYGVGKRTSFEPWAKQLLSRFKKAEPKLIALASGLIEEILL